MRIHRDSVAWLIAVAAAFTLAVLLFTPLRISLGWDEAVYASQISHHHVPLLWGAQRARGMPLLAAPVTLLNGSVAMLRVYLALLSGVGLFLALLAWRTVKPAWMLALAGLIFCGLAIVQTQAAQLYPNFWIALGGLATVGLFLRGMARDAPSRPTLVLLAVAAAFTALMRPVDAVAICAVLIVIACVLIVRQAATRHTIERRATALLLMIAAGFVISIGEWAAESYMYFGGPLSRLHETSAAVGGTKFDPVTSLRTLNIGHAASVAGYPGSTGWSYPGLLLWWFAFLLLALLGVWGARQTQGWMIAATPLACALFVYAAYSLPVRDYARYLQPCWALLAIPAAEGIGWLITTWESWRRMAAVAGAVVFLGVELGTQHQVLTREWATIKSAASKNMNAVSALQRIGVHAPCVIVNVPHPHFTAVSAPVAYYTGCRYAGRPSHLDPVRGQQVIVLLQGGGQPWPYASHWPAHKLPATRNVTAYVQERAAVSAERRNH